MPDLPVFISPKCHYPMAELQIVYITEVYIPSKVIKPHIIGVCNLWHKFPWAPLKIWPPHLWLNYEVMHGSRYTCGLLLSIGLMYNLYLFCSLQRSRYYDDSSSDYDSTTAYTTRFSSDTRGGRFVGFAFPRLRARFTQKQETGKSYIQDIGKYMQNKKAFWRLAALSFYMMADSMPKRWVVSSVIFAQNVFSNIESYTQKD